jgi:hypothetical protein
LKFKVTFLIFSFFLLFTSCHKKSISPSPPPVTYLPLATGNWWEYVYYDSVRQDSVFIREEIGDTITLFGFKGYLYQHDLLLYGFIHLKDDTVIVSQTSNYNQRRIYFINKVGTEAEWELYSVLFQYEVRAHQEKAGCEVGLKNGETYQNCIKVITRAHFLSGGSEDLGSYFFAQDLGMVKFVFRNYVGESPRTLELHRYCLK